MRHVYDDGGRPEAGFMGKCGDCVVRAVAIATELPYGEVYRALAKLNATNRSRVTAAGRKSARNGVIVRSAGFKRYMRSLGWTWTPAMGIGTGCKVHLHDGELPTGRLIVSVSKHYTAVIDGVVHDTHDPQREVHCIEPDNGRDLKPGEWRNPNGICRVERRCVYGYWSQTP